MKTGKIFWGLALILLAVLLLLDAFNVLAPLTSVIGKISVWEIVFGLILLSFVVSRICKGKWSEIFVPLAFIFMLFEENISILCNAVTPNIINNWILFLVAILLSAGVHILLHAKENHFVKVNVIDEKIQDKKRKHAGGSLGHSTVYIDSENMIPNHVENNLGSCSIYFENPEAYKGEGTLHVENNLGSMKIHVPSAWCAKVNVANTLGGLTIDENHNETGPVLYICGENDLGSVSVYYV